MTTPAARRHSFRKGHALRAAHWMPPRVTLGFVLAVGAVIFIAALSYLALLNRNESRDRLTHTLEVQRDIEQLLSLMKDAETGQRGYVLTAEDRYLAPYQKAITDLPLSLANLKAALAGNSSQLQRLDRAAGLTHDKIAELAETIRLTRAGEREAALALVRSDAGRQFMEDLRRVLADMAAEEQAAMQRQQNEVQRTAVISVLVTLVGAGVLLVLIGIAAMMTAASFTASELEKWLRAGQVGLAAGINAEQRPEALGENVLAFLAEYLDAQVGSVFVHEGGHFHCVAAYGADCAELNRDEKAGAHSLLAEAAKTRRALHVQQVPQDYLAVRSSLGSAAPAELVIAPAIVEGELQAVIELGFFRRIESADLDLLDRLAPQLGLAVRTSKDRGRLEQYLEETQRQAEELQQQQEELRVSNEELEEQGRALKESQGRLETQHAELEQVNAVLEEQAQTLEGQRDDLARAQADMAQKAQDLAKSNQYKSEFLANMSHELRTPLNSTLIFAKLLAANAKGNLDAEQINFATAISAAGEDLLALINDILDLSAIEAGKVELDPQTIDVAGHVEQLLRGFRAQAEQKKLALDVVIEPGAPQTIDTDSRRLGQILKNLLSNALKFTQQGEVSLRVAATADGIAFAVRDTGIGIAPEYQSLVFEAFKQGDGSTARKFGGTGLGLSIARDLAQLLGGDLTLASSVGEGSVFTLTLPLAYTAAAPRVIERKPVAAPLAPQAAAIDPGAARRELAPIGLRDDRDAAAGRRILIVEDDERFAGILLDLARELGFGGVVTHSGEEGLFAAAHYAPNAIVLDINLPDRTGLSVLDQLKRNPATRHIPVHIVSAVDYSQQALELGALSYALKPVKREELIEAFQKLEAKFSQGTRRVLVVEDDARQREGILHLLAAPNTEITAVATAAEALEKLAAVTYDCMVIDLNLPDLSGYELLEKMAGQEQVAFPPVIVYTGRVLSQDEEQSLRRYSKSIIVKGARSPERLVDEVTLFLHQVESKLPSDQQRMLKVARDRDGALEGRTILIAEDDVRNVYALSAVLEPKGAKVLIARNGREAIEALVRNAEGPKRDIEMVLMDIMMPEMDGLTAMREIRKLPAFKKLPILALTAKAMKDDHEKCLAAGANDYIAKPLDPDKLLSLIRVWLPK